MVELMVVSVSRMGTAVFVWVVARMEFAVTGSKDRSSGAGGPYPATVGNG